MNTQAAASKSHPIILFDGECRLCNASVNWIIAHDPRGHFRFAAQPSEVGRILLGRFEAPSLESLILLDDEKIYVRSAAVLGIARHLGLPWSLFHILIYLPPRLRDPLYDLIASHRYRWSGKIPECRLTPDLPEPFLN